MSKFTLGSRVKVTEAGKVRRGIIVREFYFTNTSVPSNPVQTEYGVTFDSDSKFLVTYFKESEMELDDGRVLKYGVCECGSKKLGHPGHSHFCPLFAEGK